MRHTPLATEELSDDTLYGAAAEHSERMATVSGDDKVVPSNGRLETDRNGFLFFSLGIRLDIFTKYLI